MSNTDFQFKESSGDGVEQLGAVYVPCAIDLFCSGGHIEVCQCLNAKDGGRRAVEYKNPEHLNVIRKKIPKQLMWQDQPREVDSRVQDRIECVDVGEQESHGWLWLGV